MGECEIGVECARWLLMASWKGGRSGGEGRKEREREGERHGFIEIQRERKCEGMYLMDLR